MANTVLAGDYSGLISFKGDKKGFSLPRTNSSAQRRPSSARLPQTTTNWSCRRAIPAWAAAWLAALLAQHSLAELAPSLELTPPKRTAITLSRSSSKTGLRLCVLLTLTTTKPSSASCTEVQTEKLAPTWSGLFICPFRPASPRLGTARCPCPCYTARTASELRRGCRLRPTRTSWQYPL